MIDMIRESLARKFHTAGFEQPEGSRRNYVKPRTELQEAFDVWVKEFSETYLDDYSQEQKYNIACELIKPLGEIPYREANSLLAGFNPKTEGQEEAGLFISACYTHSPEHIIIFDVDAPDIHYIGFVLGKNRVFVNNGETGNYFGSQSSGIVVNNGESGDFGEHCSGIVVQNGKTYSTYSDWRSEIFILVDSENPEYGIIKKEIGKLRLCRWAGGDREDFDIACAEHLKYIKNLTENQAGVDELKRYCDDLKQISRKIKDSETTQEFLQIYGPEPRTKIENDLEDILKRWGFKVQI